MSSKNKIIKVQNTPITVTSQNSDDYICLTDMAKAKEGDGRAADIIKNWIRNRATLEFLGTWEEIHNPNFKVVEFDHFKSRAGLPTFVLSVSQWIERTNAVGLFSKAGRYGGTYAHKDIAFEFGSAISPVFKLYLIKEFQHLKEEENNRLKLEWNFQRTLAKVNYHIHTDAIKENLIPQRLSKKQMSFIYADEADVLNMALFSKTAKQWRDENPDKKGNVRDYASIEQLVVLSNMESINAMLIQQGIEQHDRLKQLNQLAITQMQSLLKHKNSIKRIK
ncbi:FIG00923803: hypothetical protein [hydrothermal vent metagenome]|uniref:KilA-N domain-containing protein n=1 Tax=hydrothermal vent metagenome TaxID=652676 RepID=A0A3B1D0K3_9ZZZZ